MKRRFGLESDKDRLASLRQHPSYSRWLEQMASISQHLFVVPPKRGFLERDLARMMPHLRPDESFVWWYGINWFTNQRRVELKTRPQRFFSSEPRRIHYSHVVDDEFDTYHPLAGYVIESTWMSDIVKIIRLGDSAIRLVCTPADSWVDISYGSSASIDRIYKGNVFTYEDVVIPATSNVSRLDEAEQLFRSLCTCT